MIEILAGGPLCTVQDLGRPGLGWLGVSASGAADRASHRLANRLVGNRPDAAMLEITLGGLRLRATRLLTVAVTGAPCPLVVAGRREPTNAPLVLHAGSELECGVPPRGLRSYLAVRGGLEVAPVLGSRSTDLLAGLGPPVVRAGDRLAVGAQVERAPDLEVAPVAALPDRPVLRLLPGPRPDWLARDALATLAGSTYTVRPQSNRIGVRLGGAPLARRTHGELPSEGLVPGALQVPPDGQPVIMLADHPVTGGYPVLAVVDRRDLPLVAQLRPGQPVGFDPRHAAHSGNPDVRQS